MKRYLIALLALLPACVHAQTTPNLQLNLPTAGTSGWGDAINANFTALDGFLSGVQPVPMILLSGAVTNSTQAATKAYVDAHTSGITLTTTGSSGPATLTSGVLNIPQYSFTQVYPGAGVAVSTGTAWGTSLTLATVATSGSYADLSNKPTIPAAQVNSDWNSSTGLSQILNKPTLGTAAAQNTSAFDAAGSAATAQTAATAAFTGDVTKTAGSFATTVTKINGISLAGLTTGILKNTTTTGVPSIAVAGTDYQAPVSLTTTGTSGAATFASNVLNIPNYTFTLPTASTSVLGGVKVDGTSITIASGVISATTGGSGTVTSFSAGTLSPLFTTSVATATSTPALTFTQSTAAANTVFGNFTGIAAAPTFSATPVFSAATLTNFPTLNQNTTGSAGSVAAANITGTALPAAITSASGLTTAAGGTFGTAAFTATSAYDAAGAAATAQTNAEAAFTGDVTKSASSFATTVTKLNGTSLGGLATGLLKNTTTTGVPSIAVSGTDYVVPAGNVATATALSTAGTTTTVLHGNAAGAPTYSAVSLTTDVSGTLQAAQEPAFTGDVTKSAASLATTVTKINGTSLAGLTTGILKNTTTTGVPSIAVAGTDYQAPITLTTTGTSGAATLTSGTLNIPQYAGSGMVYPSLSGIPTVNSGTAWGPAIFYVDSNSPSSCTVSSVSYTTAFDCAFATAKAWTQTSNSGQYNATLLVGSTGLLTTNVGIQEPTATSQHASVNIIGDGVSGSVLQLTTSLGAGVCMVTQPPETTALNYATVTISGISLDANSDADCIMQINGARNSLIEHVVGKNVRAGSGNLGFQFGPSNATTSTVFETTVNDVKLEGTAGGYTPAIITCTVSSGNPVCTITDAGSYPTGTFAVQVHGVGNGSGPCSVYPTWTTGGTTTLTTLTASGGTCVAPLYVSVTPAAKVDYNFLFGPGFTDSTIRDIRAVESSAFAGIKVTGHPNTFIHPHCYVGQFACVEDDGGNTFVGIESDSIGGFAAAVEGTGSTYTGTTQIYNSFTRYAGSALFYVDQGAATNIGATMSGVSCNGNRQAVGGYHNLVIGTGLPYANTSTAGGAQDAGFAVPAGVQMDNILDCSTSPTVNTVATHIGTFNASLAGATGLPISTGISGLATGMATFLGTPSSANLAAALTDETGTGAAVFATSPTLVTPVLGTPASGTLTNATGLPISTGVSGLGTSVATFLATPTTANFAAAVTGETGTGAVVFATSPTLVTPVLGTPTSGTLTNATGLPISTGVSGLATGVATFLGTASSANLAAALTDETGTGSAVFATSPTLVTPALGTPSAAVLTNATGLPLSTGVTGTLPAANGGVPIANTTFTNATTLLTANSCSTSAVTVTMTGLATTSVIWITPNADASASTGWGANGGLILDAWPSAANTMSYKICNQTTASITPGAITWNVGAH